MPDRNKPPKIKMCRCGAPRRLLREHDWRDNGIITQVKNPDSRLLFLDNESLIQIFGDIETVIGQPIDHIVSESQRRMTYEYIRVLVPGYVRMFARWVSIKPVAQSLVKLGRMMGQGDVRLTSYHYKMDGLDHVAIAADNIFYLPVYTGVVAGAMEAITGLECAAHINELPTGEYEVKALVSKHPCELEERLPKPEYSNRPVKPGMRWKRCPFCGEPEAFGASFGWMPERGEIFERSGQQRMVMSGAAELDAVFLELARELGEEIEAIIINAQRRLTRANLTLLERSATTWYLREYLALRGLGYLDELEFTGDALRARVVNPALNLLLVGILQGLFEDYAGVDKSYVSWAQNQNGDLAVTVGRK